jgi:hypothetical protein
MTTGNYKPCKLCGHYTKKFVKHGAHHLHEGCWRRIKIAKALREYKPTFWERVKYTITRKPIEVEINL